MYWRIFTGWLIFCGITMAEVAWEKIRNEEELEKTFQILDDFREGDVIAARSRLNDLEDRFRQVAMRYREESQEAGDLDAVLAVDQSLEVL